MRVLGLDLGKKSCGLAISDSLNITAQGLENFIFDEYKFDDLIHHLIDIVSKHDVHSFVVGYPTYPSGDKSETTEMVEYICSLINNALPNIKIIYVDENGTTKAANDLMINAGLSRTNRKKFKDKIAAQLILKDYLEKINNKKTS